MSECPCHTAFPVLACLPPMATGLTLHRLGLWELTPPAAQVKAQCINGGPLFTQAGLIKCFERNRSELGAVGHCPFRLLILGMDHPEGLSFHRHPRELLRKAWECLGAREWARVAL